MRRAARRPIIECIESIIVQSACDHNYCSLAHLCRHLSGNSIVTVCGLESARCLEELHVARQRLARGQTFAIDQASIDGIKVQQPTARSTEQ